MPLRASGVESCSVSSSLPIPARNKQDMQPSSPLGVFSSTPPQLGQVCCEGACICLRCGFCLFCAPHGNDKMVECPTLMESTIHVYEVRPRKDKRGVDS